MSDLRCIRCGAETTFADAQIMDIRGDRDHEWVEIDGGEVA